MSLYLECTLDLCQFSSILYIVILDNFIFTLTWYSKWLDIVNERCQTGSFTISRLGCICNFFIMLVTATPLTKIIWSSSIILVPWIIYLKIKRILFFIKKKMYGSWRWKNYLLKSIRRLPSSKKKCFGRLHPTLEIAAATRASSEKKNYNTITA